MTSKEVTTRTKSATSLASLSTAEGKGLAPSILAELAPGLEPPEAAPDVALLIELVLRRLVASSGAMNAADHANNEQLRDDHEPRTRRSAHFDALYDAAVSYRESVDYHYGAKGIAELGLSGNTPRDAVALGTYVDQLLIAAPKAQLPPPRAGRPAWDVIGPLAGMNATRADLGIALEDVAREEREADVSLADKLEAMDRFDDTYRRTARLFEALYAFVHMDELAERVRPPSHGAKPVEPVAPLTP